ncbi:hypothetical protein [uncultured Cohaesibacter sp.]|uniref:hypothetical protein n=1 Tax=uncultured Cohaesibacter sp. TaxID=1002546 RepID=UPI002AABEA74|nr:hypothetical protein [uncultured Cohaesibacter sp.]
MADGSEKPIEEVGPDDWVLSYDKDGNLKPGRVTRTFINAAKQILDVHGLMVTPGHVTWIYSPSLPKPEDYVLQRSAPTLNDIYQANEWEAIQPQTPMPSFLDLPNASISKNPAVIQSLPSNVPLSMRNGPRASRQAMSRQQRRAAEARARKTTKRKKVTVR